jgi:hypothetical protein
MTVASAGIWTDVRGPKAEILPLVIRTTASCIGPPPVPSITVPPERASAADWAVIDMRLAAITSNTLVNRHTARLDILDS